MNPPPSALSSHGSKIPPDIPDITRDITTQFKSIGSLNHSVEESELSHLLFSAHIPVSFSSIIKKATVASTKQTGIESITNEVTGANACCK